MQRSFRAARNDDITNAGAQQHHGVANPIRRGGAGRVDRAARPAGPVTHGHERGGSVRHDHRDGERAGAPTSLFLHGKELALERLVAAAAGADDDAHAVPAFIREDEARLIHRFLGGGDGKLLVAILAACFFARLALFRIEALHFTDGHGLDHGQHRLCQRSEAGSAFASRLPTFRHVQSDGRNGPHPGNDNSMHRHFSLKRGIRRSYAVNFSADGRTSGTSVAKAAFFRRAASICSEPGSIKSQVNPRKLKALMRR